MRMCQRHWRSLGLTRFFEAGGTVVPCPGAAFFFAFLGGRNSRRGRFTDALVLFAPVDPLSDPRVDLLISVSNAGVMRPEIYFGK